MHHGRKIYPAPRDANRQYIAPGAQERRRRGSGAKSDISRLGRFFQTYYGFLSSFVIGVAGLVGDVDLAIPAVADRDRAGALGAGDRRTKAENDWRIARAEILSKNLNVLSTQGPADADQRFGVLLSLTRGAIIDPELAVSYALELGKDNATTCARCWRRRRRRTTTSWRRGSSSLACSASASRRRPTSARTTICPIVRTRSRRCSRTSWRPRPRRARRRRRARCRS